MANRGGKVEVVIDFLFWALKLLRIVTAAMNQKIFASQQESCDKPRQCVEKQIYYSADKGPL